jgi:plasmid stabilization system protein ParE
MRLRLSAAALRDLTEAVDFIAAENPEAALRLRARLIEAAESLRDFPALAPMAGDGRRIFTVSGTRFRLLYRVREQTVLILRILHGARQWPPESS